MDILGIHIGDNRLTAFQKLKSSYSIETGKNCFAVRDYMFGNYLFSITYTYEDVRIKSIRLSYVQSKKGMKGRIESSEEVAKKAWEYCNENLGLTISESKTEKGRCAIWSDLNITVKSFYQIHYGKEQYLSSQEVNSFVLEITDFATNIKDDEARNLFLQVRSKTFKKNDLCPGKEEIRISRRFTFQSLKLILIILLILLCLFVYAFSHRYQVVHNGRGIVDKWTGTVEEVKIKN